MLLKHSNAAQLQRIDAHVLVDRLGHCPIPGLQAGIHPQVVDRPLDAKIPASVRIGAVESPIHLVVLLIMAHEVLKREPVAAGDEIQTHSDCGS